ncbi:MAG: NAD(P)H-dependent oxidoreductase subunit E [Anaerolineales bacterium]|nr:NAD(P)H-dependent oxidoreductase subunit E [Anaerolineales bacterium]MCX7754131.1 NAD(P)H-dependent oxidoreductase subunit E [Anaerolineales bacterium]MDW8278045.1 NAD(P)H-dependent oxidoreductase subunit E [Anaerolineales bacterium]
MEAVAKPHIDGLCEDKRALLDEIIEQNRERPGALMVVLNETQSKIGYVSVPIQHYIAKKMRVPVGAVHGVVTFYSFFTTEPRGKHTMKFCMGTACYVGGVPQLMEKAKQITGTEIGRTTPDGQLTLEVCRCVGACSQAPVVMVDDEIVGRIKPNKFPQLIKKLLES